MQYDIIYLQGGLKIKEYDTKRIDSNELSFLRANTTLGPVAKIKITQLQAAAEKMRKLYLKAEGELLESDYSIADEFEYEARLRVWENKCAALWKKSGDGLGLSEFAQLMMEQQMNEVRTPKRR